MSLYDINFSQQAIDIQSPDKRDASTIAVQRAILKPLQWCTDLNSGFRTGAIAAAYAGGTYAKYAQVLYKKGVYESLINGNTALPDDATKWILIQTNFIGIDERSLYNGTKLTFEWALNKWFGTTFRQPDLVSDIYLTTNATNVTVFRVGLTELESSSVGLYTSSQMVYNDYSFAIQYNMTINIPTAVYDALGVDKEQIVRNFADLYVTAGIIYNITPY